MPKAILFTTDFAPSQGGGICTHANFMVRSLMNQGWDFIVLCEYYIHSSDIDIRNYSEKAGINIYRLPPAPSKCGVLKKVLFCLKICKNYRPNVIIGTGRHPTWFAALTSKLLRIPLVTVGHGTEFTQSTSKYDFKLNRWAYGRSKLIISISEYTKKIIIKSGIKSTNVRVIQNPANEYIFRKLNDKEIDEFKIRNNIYQRRVLLTVGSISERKGQRIIIECLPKLVQTNPDILYVAIGPPTLREEYYKLAVSLGVKEHVFFPGVISEKELVLWLNACEIFAMTSLNVKGDYEGFGIAVIEAALCGKASIVSDNGGLKEAVIHNKTGIVVPENDIETTRKVIFELLNDETKLCTLSENALENALKNNTWRTIGQKYHEQITSVILKKKQ